MRGILYPLTVVLSSPSFNSVDQLIILFEVIWYEYTFKILIVFLQFDPVIII